MPTKGANMQFLKEENASSSQMCLQIQNVHGRECIACRSVFRLCRDFHSGRSSTNDRSRFRQEYIVYEKLYKIGIPICVP